MSIALGMQRALRSFRSLMCFDAARFFIKDLKDHLLTMEIARGRPSRYGEKNGSCYRRTRGTGNRAPKKSGVFAQVFRIGRIDETLHVSMFSVGETSGAQYQKEKST